MIDIHTLFQVLGAIVVLSPVALLGALGGSALIGFRPSERVIARLTQVSVTTGLATSVAIVILMLIHGTRFVPIEFGDWAAIPEHHFHFRIKFIFDRLSVPFVILTFVLCGTVGAFTTRYLHRDSGFCRFFIAYALFTTGMVTCALAGTIETLFVGWELVGLASALLVAYFHDRLGPVRNGQRVWSVYRLSDAAFLIAALTMHHLTGEGDFSSFVGEGPWPEGRAVIDTSHAFFVGLLLFIAAAGKSGLVPFSGWLPRAMEGPTPSSAVFYGALSIHLGAYLLLRVSPILEASLALQVIVIAVGLVTAVFASMISRVQADIKGSLAYASLAQVGIIVVEIGFGLRYIALIHIIGHACMRTLQLLRSPSLLHDYRSLEDAIGSNLTHHRSLLTRLLPLGFRRWWYSFSLERGFMDSLLDHSLVHPFKAFFKATDRAERWWTDFLSTESRQPESPTSPIQDRKTPRGEN